MLTTVNWENDFHSVFFFNFYRKLNDFTVIRIWFNLCQAVDLYPKNGRQRIDFECCHQRQPVDPLAGSVAQIQNHEPHRVHRGNNIYCNWKKKLTYLKLNEKNLCSKMSQFFCFTIWINKNGFQIDENSLLYRQYSHECRCFQIWWPTQFLWIFDFQEEIEMSHQNANQWVHAATGQNQIESQ